MTEDRRNRGLVRPYVVTDGRARPTRNTLDVVTLVFAARDVSSSGLSPEKRRVVRLCRGGALSVGEVAGRLALPVSVTKVLLADLVDSCHISARPPIPPAQRQASELLQEVLNGLRAHL